MVVVIWIECSFDLVEWSPFGWCCCCYCQLPKPKQSNRMSGFIFIAIYADLYDLIFNRWIQRFFFFWKKNGSVFFHQLLIVVLIFCHGFQGVLRSPCRYKFIYEMRNGMVFGPFKNILLIFCVIFYVFWFEINWPSQDYVCTLYIWIDS